MYSTNRNIQIKLNHKLCKIKSRYIKLQYNVWQDFSLARFQLHVFLRLVKPTLKADIWEQSMSDVALKSIRLFLSHIKGRGGVQVWKFIFFCFAICCSTMFLVSKMCSVTSSSSGWDFTDGNVRVGITGCRKIYRKYPFVEKSENVANFCTLVHFLGPCMIRLTPKLVWKEKILISVFSKKGFQKFWFFAKWRLFLFTFLWKMTKMAKNWV